MDELISNCCGSGSWRGKPIFLKSQPRPLNLREIQLIADILAEEYRVLKAYNGKQALEIARTHRPTVIVSDVMMPKMTGLELIEALRDDPATRNIPVILLSAAIPRSLATKADAFLSKPFELEALEQLVARFVKARHQAHDTLDNTLENEEGPEEEPPSINYPRQKTQVYDDSDDETQMTA
jgi:CheY-like chemotaxis protein